MSMRIKQARLTIEELHQLKWLLGGALTLLSLWALGSLELNSGFHLTFGMAAVFVALIRPQMVAAIPPIFWRFAAPAMLVIVLVDFGFGFINFFPPLMRMVILLLAYRALAPRTRREDLQLVLLCLFGIVVSGALTVSLLFAVQILLFTPIAMALLLVICLLDRSPEESRYLPSWKRFSWRKLIRRVWWVVDIRVLAWVALLFTFVVSVSTALFVLIPRFNLEQAIPFMQLQAEPKSGFSDVVKLGSVSEITEDHSIALRVDAPSMQAIMSTPYWRILILDQYHDGEFRLSSQSREFRRQERLRSIPSWDDWQVPFQQRKAQLWTFYFEGGISQYLPLPGAFQSMRFPTDQDTVLLPDLHVVGLDVVPQSAVSYQIEDLLWDVRAPASAAENQAFFDFSTSVEIQDEDMLRYPLTTLGLDIDQQDRARLSRLNRDLIGQSPKLSVAEYSQLVTSHLRGNFRYSLTPNGTNQTEDPVVAWITAGDAGHCELFASAFVLLARDAGYPARMVVGFVGGGWNTVEDFFVVRNSDAHAWAEIYDAYSQEWLRVDPTPGASPSNPDLSLPASFEMETGISAWVDSLRMQWYRRIVNFDQQYQVELATSMLDLGNQLLKSLSIRFKEARATLIDWLQHPFSRGSFISGGVLLCLCLGMVYFWRTRLQWLHLFSRLLRRPPGLDPTRKMASRLLNRVQVQMTELDLNDSRLDTLRGVLKELEAVRFGPAVTMDVAKSAFARAKQILRNRH